jgi:hypothetical protein
MPNEISESEIVWDETPTAESVTWEKEKEPLSWGEWARQKAGAGLVGARETLPFAKDIAAATKAYVGVPGVSGPSGDFREAKQGIEQQQEAAAKESPLAYGAGEVGAFFAPGVGLAKPVAAAETAVAKAAEKAVPMLGKTGANVIGASTTGAGLGAVQGLGEGVDISDRLSSAAESGTVGGALGAAFPIAGKALGMGRTAAEEAAARFGISMPASIASTNPLTRTVTGGLSNLPVTRSILEKGTAKGLSQLGEALERPPGIREAGLGAEEAGKSAKESLMNWVSSESKDNVNKLYGKVTSLVDPNVKTPMSNTLAAVQKIDAERLAAKLGDSSAAKLVMDAATDPNGLTYEGAQRLKREIGEKMKGLFTQSELSETELKLLYGGLKEDVKKAAEAAGGPKALAAFNRANDYAQKVIERRKELGKIIGVKGDANDEKVFSSLFRMAQDTASGNASRLKAARKSMDPESWQDVTSGVIAKMGRDVEGNFSPDRFVTAYSKMTDAGKNTLFGPLGNPLRNSIEDILTVSQRYKEVGKDRNFSNTALALMGGLGLYEVASEGVAGIEKEAGLAAAGIPAAFVLSRPRLAAVVARYLKNPNDQALRNARNVIQMEMREHFGASPKQIAAEDREERAFGGKVGKKDYPAKRLTRLERAARKAHNQIALETKPLMSRPDEQIVQALEIAKGK